MNSKVESLHDNFKIGVSSCLLGNKVRFDGGHKHDKYITGTLSNYFDFVPVCPEVECGLSIPRESMRLVGKIKSPKLVGNKTGNDYTTQMQSWALENITKLEQEELCGFIFKSKSPSSGMERVKVYDKNNVPQASGVGIFTSIFMEKFPLLPVEEEGRLHDPGLRENFIENVFVYKRWRDLLLDFTLKGLVQFHTTHKYLLLSHNQKNYRELGRLIAQAGTVDPTNLIHEYQGLLMQTMRLKTTTKKHVNVLLHMVGYFKKVLSKDEKAELLEMIDNYAKHLVPLIVPITLINHYVRKYDQRYLKEQIYLTPHPLELKLRNHV